MNLGNGNIMYISALAGFISLVITFILLIIPFGFLPKDKGREYAVNGSLSKGKTRGVGLLIVIGYIVASLITDGLFFGFSSEKLIYIALIFLMMLSGYLDDASLIPWSDYKKGAIDFTLAVIAAVVFVIYNDPTISLFGYVIVLPKVVYAVLAVILIWMSINVTNCSDGVDGLCANVSIVSLISFAVICFAELGNNAVMCSIMSGALIAYLFFNTSPSTMLMGDAGSRAIGFLLALVAMKSGRPILWLPLVFVMLIDGGLGLAKVFLLRFLKIHILKNTRTPIHDHLRKNKNWSDAQVVYRFVLIQIIICVVVYLLV